VIADDADTTSTSDHAETTQTSVVLLTYRPARGM
jgi:hypothetical protein